MMVGSRKNATANLKLLTIVPMINPLIPVSL